MSIQPLLSSQRAPEMPASRRRAETGPGEGFALPEQQDGAAGDGEPGVSGKAGATEAALAAAAAMGGAGLKSANGIDEAVVKSGHIVAKASAPNPAEPQADRPAAAAGAAAFLAAVATAQADEGAVKTDSKPKPEETEAEAGDADGAGEPQGADQAGVAAEAPHPALLAVLPLPAGAPVSSGGGPATGGTEASLATGEAVKGRALPAALAGFAKTEAKEAEPTVGADVAGEAIVGAGGASPAKAGDASEGKKPGENPAVATGAKADGAAAAEFKPLDSLQQALGPLDLSAMLQQASGKPGHDRLIQPVDPNALPNGAAAAAQTPGVQAGQPTPIHVVPIEIGLRAMAGAREFDIRLDPDELGRVDVRLSISDAGEVSARLVVDRVETLHLLQRDARTLERAFEQAGLKPSDGGVDISLRDPSDQSAFRQNRQHEEAPQRPRPPQGIERAEEASLSTGPAPQRRIVRLGGVDLSI